MWGMSLLLLRAKLWVLSFLPIVKHCTTVGFTASPTCFWVSILFGQRGGVALQGFRVLFCKKTAPSAAVDSVVSTGGGGFVPLPSEIECVQSDVGSCLHLCLISCGLGQNPKLTGLRFAYPQIE